MKSEKGVYLIDTLDNLRNIAALGPRFAQAVKFLTENKLDQLTLGRHEIDGTNVYANVDDSFLIDPAKRKAELHHTYYDIQVPLGTDEVIGLATFKKPAVDSFDETRDIGFYDQPVTRHIVHRGEFGLFWPRTCLHAPACTLAEPHTSRKIVVKVRA